MTIIAVKKENEKITIAYDSRIIRDNEKIDQSVILDKVIQTEPLYVAIAGPINENILLRHYLLNVENFKSDEPIGTNVIIPFMVKFFSFCKEVTKEDPESEYIIVKDNRIFFIDANLRNIWEVKDFIAIGNGAKYGITALHLGKSPKEAVKIACELDIYCDEPIKEIVIF